MNNDFINVVKEIFEHPEMMTPQRIGQLIEETGHYFRSLEAIMRSGDEEAKDAALGAALELRQFLESKIHIFSPMFERNFNEKEKQIISEINEGIRVNL